MPRWLELAIAALAIAVFFIAVEAHAAPTAQAVVRALMAEIQYKGPAPDITLVNQHELVEICQCKNSRGGIYRDSSIYLWIGVDLDSLFGQSIVLHELQHHIQFVRHGFFRGCDEWYRREWEAIRAQNDWLSAHGSASRALFMGECAEGP